MSVSFQRLTWRQMDASTPNLRKLLAHAVLGLLLLLGQHYATRHCLSHAIEAIQAKATQAKATGTPAQTHCDECDGLVAFGAALPALAGTLSLVTDFGNVQVFAPSPSAPVIAALSGYWSRAPPPVG